MSPRTTKAKHTAKDSKAESEADKLTTVIEIPSFQIGISLLTLFSVVAMTLLYHFGQPQTQETLKFLVAAGALGGGALGARYAWLGLKTNLEQKQQILAEQKIELALSFVRRWNDPNMAEIRRKWRQLCEELERDPNGIVEILKNDIGKRTVIADILNFFEEISYAAHSGAADVETLRSLFRSPALNYFKIARPWIEHKQSGSAKACAEFEWLFGTWKND